MPIDATLFHRASAKVINKPLEAYPNAAKIQNMHGNSPLHIAI
jgi:hypothetical protein